MQILPPIESLVDQWARNRIRTGSSEKESAMNAAIGLCLAALQPVAAPDQRTQWMGHAAQLCPALGYEVAQMAWALPPSDVRTAFRKAWPKINPNQAHSEASDYTPGVPFGAQSPPIMMALAYGNLTAVQDTISDYGAPVPQMATKDTENHRSPLGMLAQPGSWLAWALAFRQWDLADYLFTLPSMRTPESLDRALLEVSGTLSTPVAANQDPLAGVSAARACDWIRALAAAGANWHAQHEAIAPYGKYEWFMGSSKGLDRLAIEKEGWVIHEKDPYLAYTHFAKRPLPQGEKCPAPSPAQRLMCENGPIGWQPKEKKTYDNEREEHREKIKEENIQHAMTHDIPTLGVLWKGATSQQWAQTFSAMVAAHGQILYTRDGFRRHHWRPDFLLDGFGELQAEDVFHPHAMPGNPHCLWLDAIAIHMVSMDKLSENTKTTEFYGRAVESMARCLHGNPEAFTAGLQRAMIFSPQRQKIRFSTASTHGDIDDCLAIPGMMGLLHSLPDAFQENFKVFAARDRQLHAHWVAITTHDDDVMSLGPFEVEAIERASSALDLHRGTLPALGNMPAVRPAPRM